MSTALIKALDSILEIGEISKSAVGLKIEAENNGKDITPVLEKSKDLVQILKRCIEYIEESFDKISIANGENDGVKSGSDTTPELLQDSDSRPLIKVVDINKLLVKPTNMKNSTSPLKEKKSVQFDSSVIIIESSDDEGGSRRSKRRISSKITLKRTNPSSDSSDNEMSDREIKTSTPRRTRYGRRNVTKKVNYEISDTSSSESPSSESDSGEQSSDSVVKYVRPSPKCKKAARQSKGEEIDWKNDTKFKSKCVVNLLRLPCEGMEEFNKNTKEDKVINRLTDLSTLKNHERRETAKSDNSKSKQSKAATSNNSDTGESTSSEHECQDDPSNASEESMIFTPTPMATPAKFADIALELLKSDEEKQSDHEGDKTSNNSEEMPTTSDSPKLKKRKRKDTSDTSSDGGDDNQPEKKKAELDTPENDSFIDEVEELQEIDDTGNVSDHKTDKTNDGWKKDKLLTEKLTSSDSDADLSKTNDEKDSSDDEISLKALKKRATTGRMKKKKAIVSDSESEEDTKGKDTHAKNKNNKDDFKVSEDEKSTSSSSNSDNDKKKISKPARKRVQKMDDSSEDSNEEDKTTRKQIRKVMGRDSLAETTLKAGEEEKKRKARIAEKQKKYNQIYDLGVEARQKVDKVVLDFDEKTKEELVKVDETIVEKLKPHQAAGVRFMWDACFESLDRARSTKGSGCILAHCMGLGKSLQVIALIHTLLKNEETKIKRVMIVCPLSTVLNWVNEFKLWLPNEEDCDIYELVSFKLNFERQYQLKQWYKNGGVLIIGYDMFRNLSNPNGKRCSKKMKAVFMETLVDPGADLVICDEGHLLKNEKTNLSVAMNRLKTMRRIVLTGTPLQNNLKEYFCMLQFIKPNLLGTYKEYLNRFVNPITNGQYTDSTPSDTLLMRKRSHVLHRMLDGVVQRRDYAVLAPYLPPKHEYVLFLNLTDTQIKLYDYYLKQLARQSSDGSNRTSFLFVDFQALQRICTHPRVLLDKSNQAKAKEELADEDSEGSLRNFIDDGSDSSASSSSDTKSGSDVSVVKTKKRVTRLARAEAVQNGEDSADVIDVSEDDPKEWWQDICDGDELDNLAHSSKLTLLFEILKECEQIGDKVLLFSQSLYSLNVIEYFLDKIQTATENESSLCGFKGSWILGVDYFRLDGSTSCDNRSACCKIFNDTTNTRARLFLISTRAGGLGINLTGANRVIIFDVSWNPSHDIQSIYRVYRFGQEKPCYIYRFVTYGTMEMKIYERQVIKQAISKRVIDEQQIDRHYNASDLLELYKFEPSPGQRPTPLVPKDVLLGELLQKFEDRIYKYHEHQSLLENKEEECLNEEERKLAWEEFETEKTLRVTYNNFNLGGMSMMSGLPPPPNMSSPDTIVTAIKNMMRRDKPTSNETELNHLASNYLRELQAEMIRGDDDRTLQLQVQREMQSMVDAYHKRWKDQFHQQQMMKFYQQQMMKAAAGGGDGRAQNPAVVAGPSRIQPKPIVPNEIIELND